MDLKNIRIGTSVTIKRSNGRMHDACISGIDTDKKFVSVEWIEGKDTKGKEVDLDQLFALNPQLLEPQSYGSEQLSAKKKEDRKTFFSPASAIPKPKSLAELNDSKPKGYPPLPISSQLNSKSQSQVSGGGPVRHAGKPNGRHPISSSQLTSKSQSHVSSSGVQNDVRHSVPKEKPHVLGHPPRPVSSSQLSSKPKPQVSVGGVKSDMPHPTPVSHSISKEKPNERRKSNCVKEVEKLKKNRDDRRAKAVEHLQQRLEDVDRSHPHWEFMKMIREYKQGIDQVDYSYTPMASNNKICVCVRKRPLNKKELKKKDLDVITIPDGVTSVVHEPKLKVDLTKYLENHEFRFDYAFDESVSNQTVYRCAAQPLVYSIFEQGMATCFAYGQTGSGKTHTMGGSFTGKDQDSTAGIYALAAADVFGLISKPKYSSKDLVVSSSYFEIYSGKVFDLLNKKQKLQILEDAKQQVQVVGLTEHPVTNVEAVWKLIKTGNATRTSGTTSANQNSSRSHAVFQLILRKRKTAKLHGKFSLIDLAGNERGADTMTGERQTRMEGAEINKSLLALKECIRALGRKGSHLPFRASKLTQVLRDSFIGDNARTCMIAMISPAFSCCEHTLNTLRYADRVKELGCSNKPPPSGSPSEALPAPAEDVPTEANAIPDSSADLKFLIKDDPNSSSELISFHEAMDKLIEAEELLTENYKAAILEQKNLLAEQEKLISYVDGIDYNIGNHTKALEEYIDRSVDILLILKEHLTNYKDTVEREETASKKIKRLPYM